MSSLGDVQPVAAGFVDAIVRLDDWPVLAAFCRSNATFSAQAKTLDRVKTVREYHAWCMTFVGTLDDVRHELKAIVSDPDLQTALAYAVFRATVPKGSPIAPDGGQVAGDYVYVMQFQGGLIRHVTKIWNDHYMGEAVVSL
jgi:ketosteroid isomerase-like protein